MPRLYLVRHGKIDGSKDADPGLGDVGRAQAETVAAKLAPIGPLPIVTSPFRRTRETAAPLARIWGMTPSTDTRIGEIPLPPDLPHRGHAEFFEYARTRRWPELHESLQRWRDQVVQALFEIKQDTVVVTHFVAIGIAVGQATGDDRLSCFEAENCSCTIVDSGGQVLRLVKIGTASSTARDPGGAG